MVEGIRLQAPPSFKNVWVYSKTLLHQKIVPFIKKYEVDATEFLDPIETFSSFNSFFCRKLKKEARPLAKSPAIMPADGRFLFYQNLATQDGFVIKGKKFSLVKLLQDPTLASHYENGSMVIARLCPSDYHRFHFPCSCTPMPSKLINGFLYSVNPISIQQNIELFTENKRCLTELNTDLFGKVLFIEIGATCVGTIHQTYIPYLHYEKGEEKGYFSFGGSSIILLFEQNSILFDSDLVEASLQHIETLCLMGQSLGKVINS